MAKVTAIERQQRGDLQQRKSEQGRRDINKLISYAANPWTPRFIIVSAIHMMKGFTKR